MSILFLLPPHCKVGTTERFRIRTTKNPKTTKMELKEARWNPFRPDCDYPGWMKSENHSRQASGTRRWSLAFSEEASEGRKHKQKHPNHQNLRKWTQVAQFGLRIRLFESHRRRLSIAHPPRPQTPPENSQNQHFSKNPKIPKSETFPWYGPNRESL